MDICNQCDIEEKILVCCGRYPQNGGQGVLQIKEGRQVLCCPHLGLSGRCGIYDQRPSDCRNYFCHRYELSDAGNSDAFAFLARLMEISDIRETE